MAKTVAGVKRIAKPKEAAGLVYQMGRLVSNDSNERNSSCSYTFCARMITLVSANGELPLNNHIWVECNHDDCQISKAEGQSMPHMPSRLFYCWLPVETQNARRSVV
jgi:hypothetical protein